MFPQKNLNRLSFVKGIKLMKSPISSTNQSKWRRLLPRIAKMKMHKLTKKGFSIVEVMVAAGLLSIISYGLMSIVTGASKQQKGIVAKDGMRELTGEIRGVLSSVAACTQSFASTDLTIATGTSPSFTKSSIKDAVGTNKYFVGGLYINKILKLGDLVVSKLELDAASSPQTGIAELNIIAEKVGDIEGSRTTHQTISLKMTFNTAGFPNRISECVSLSAASESIWKLASNMTDIYYNGGNVGIGTTTPNALLDLSGGPVWTTRSWMKQLKLGNGAAIQFGSGSNSFLMGETFNLPPNRFYLGPVTGNTAASVVTYSLVMDDVGNVGIGTQNPTSKLEVGGGNVLTNVGWRNDLRTSTLVFPLSALGIGNHYHFIGAPSTNGNGDLYFGTTATTDGLSAPNYSAYIDGSTAAWSFFKKVSVGKPNPLQALDVNGALRITKVGSESLGNGAIIFMAIPGTINPLGKELVISNSDGAGGPNDVVWIGNHISGAFAQTGNITLAAKSISVLGDLNVTGCINGIGNPCVSDVRLKDHVRPFEPGLEALRKIRPSYYRYNGLGGKEISDHDLLGVIAQDVESGAPELISTEKLKLNPDDKDTTEIKRVNYSALIYVVINAVKELYAKWLSDHTEIERLKNENIELRNWACRQDRTATFCMGK